MVPVRDGAVSRVIRADMCARRTTAERTTEYPVPAPPGAYRRRSTMQIRRTAAAQPATVVWTTSADAILNKVRRGRVALNNVAS
jgi:hypothetical protein